MDASIYGEAREPIILDLVSDWFLQFVEMGLELGGYDIPTSMQRRSLAAGQSLSTITAGNLSADQETIIGNRLSGLGYLS